MFFTALSAFAFSVVELTFPCNVTRPSVVSTLIAVPLTSSVVSSAIFALVVIQASDTAAPAIAGAVTQNSAAANAACVKTLFIRCSFRSRTHIRVLGCAYEQRICHGANPQTFG